MTHCGVPIPEQFREATHKEGADRLLRELSFRGAHERYGEQLSGDVRERIEYELRVVADMDSLTTFSSSGPHTSRA